MVIAHEFSPLSQVSATGVVIGNGRRRGSAVVVDIALIASSAGSALGITGVASTTPVGGTGILGHPRGIIHNDGVGIRLADGRSGSR